MATKEQIFARLWHESSFRRDWIIGGLVFYIPIVNLLWIGWMSLTVKNVIRGGAKPLPHWVEWRDILEESLRALPLFLVYALGPALLGGLLTWILNGLFYFIHLDLLAWSVAWVPLAIVAFAAPALFLRSLVRYHKTEDMTYSLNWGEIFHKLTHSPDQWIPSTLMGWGIVAVGWPLIGFAAFFALTGFAMHYTSQCMRPESHLT